jgi:hypothetical protein
MRRFLNMRQLNDIRRQRQANPEINQPRFAIANHTSLHGYYDVQINALQSVTDNLIRFMNGPHSRSPLARGYFQPEDSLDVVFIMRPNADMNALPSELEEDIRSFLLYTIGITEQTPITITMELTRMSIGESRQWLGGAARVVSTFSNTNQLQLERFMEIMWEKMYVGFNFSDIRVEVSIRMSDFLRARIRGGHVVNMDELSRMFRDIPVMNHSLLLFDFWPPSLKGYFRKRQKVCGPSHLIDVKGLLFYEWKPEWYPYCGLMALMYARMSLESKLTLNVFDTSLTTAANNEAFIVSCEQHFSELLQRMDSYQTGQKLYDLAQSCLESNPDLRPIASFPTLYQLGVICNYLFPTFTLVVYDKSRHVLYRHSGENALLNDPPLLRYMKGQLTPDVVKTFTKQRLCIYYDHLSEHFLPIFNLATFLQRRSIDVSFRLDTMYSSETAASQSSGAHVMHTKDRQMTYCPYCDRGIYVNKEDTHECHQLRCFCCQVIFFSLSELLKHIDPSLLQSSFRCKSCGQVCFGKHCFRRHRLICNKTVYLRCYQCQRNVLKTYAAKHQCHKYKCFNCEKDVLNPIVYTNPNHPNGYIKYHRCSMKPPARDALKEIEKECSRSFFAFDFESRLDRDVFKDIVIHIHVVNCISSAPIYIARNQEERIGLEQKVVQNTVTQSSLEDFWNHLVTVSTSDENIWIAHNFKGYDGRILYDFLVHDMGIVPFDIIKAGGKIMKLVFLHPNDMKRRLIFQDSLCHIATSLAMMPSMFGLDRSVVKKGYFPYKFNVLENEDYIGPIPDKAYFDYDRISDKTDFDIWYAEKLKEPYDFQNEMRTYCENDVLVLSLSLSAYMSICLEYSFGINPMLSLTIAQFTFFMYKAKFLPRDTIYFLDESLDTFARRALHGGNTNTRRLYYSCTPSEAGTIQHGEKGLRYIDVQSLYPTVQYYDPLPVGYPITNFFTDNQQPSEQKLRTFFGFIECDLVPVKNVFHPFIARYSNHRLSMDLHPHRRVVVTSVEFQAAVFGEEAYCDCTHVYRIDEYQSSTSLFKQFIEVWLKLKIISSKPPPIETFSTFQTTLKERLNIDVTWDEFNFNPSLRTLAKLVLNSLWGKFGQRTKMPKTKIFQTANQLYDYYEKIRMGLYEEKEHLPVGHVSFIKKFVETQEWNKKNTAVACFVTAHARRRLGTVLSQLGNRVLYHDTDSIIYERRRSTDWMVPEGQFLGDWESETGDCMIHEFVSLAPKTYAYRYQKQNGDIVEFVKSKGFSMNAATRTQLCFDNYKRLIFGEASKIDITTTFFRHSEEAGFMFTTDGHKSLSFQYSKGFIDWDTFETLPYGCQRFLEDYETPVTVSDALDLVLKDSRKQQKSFDTTENEVNSPSDTEDDLFDGFFSELDANEEEMEFFSSFLE